MAINDKPIFAPGQRIPEDVLRQWFDRAGLGTMDTTVSEAGGVSQSPRTSWYDTSVGKFSPVVQRLDQMRQEGNGESTSWVPTGQFDDIIAQARNDSTWGANNVADVWDSKGNYLGTSSGSADMRNLATIAAMALGGYGASMGGTAGAVGTGALKGAATGAMAAGATDRDLSTGMLAGAAGGAVTGGINAYGTEQGWNPAVTKAVSAGTNTALRGGDGGDILKAGLLSGTGSLANVPTTSTSTGSSMDFSIDPSLYDNGDFGTVLTNTYSDPGAFDFSNFNQYDFGFDPSLFATDGGGFDLGKMLKSFLGSDLGKLGLAGLAAYDAKDQKQTMTKDPWGPAQPYLKGLMADGATLYDQYKQNPFSAQQKTAYNNLGGLLNTINANAGGLMSGFQANASGANNFDRSNPRKQLTGSSFDMSQFAPGLFNFFPK